MKQITKLIIWIICIKGIMLSLWNIDIGTGVMDSNRVFQLVGLDIVSIAENGWIQISGLQLWHIGMYSIIFFTFIMSILFIKEVLRNNGRNKISFK